MDFVLVVLCTDVNSVELLMILVQIVFQEPPIETINASAITIPKPYLIKIIV